MKRTTILSCLLFFISFSAFSQILNPVKWAYSSKKVNATEAIVYIKATIEPGWHLYSQFVKEGGPVKTTFNFPAATTYALTGKTIEPKPVIKFEPTFKMDVSYFEKSVIFQQKVKLKGKTATIKGSVEFMVCNDKQCLPPDEVQFSIPVK